MTELEQEVKDMIEQVIDRKYISKLTITHDNNIWTLYLYLNRELVPLNMSIEGDEEKFKKFVRKELRRRRLHEVKYWKTDLVLPSLDCNGELGW